MKNQVKKYIRNLFPEVQFRYAGKSKIMYIVGQHSESAEIAADEYFGYNLPFTLASEID